MNVTKFSILISLFVTTSQGKKHYTLCSVDALLNLLLKYHNISVGRRWAFECLRWLEDEGYIVRRQRYRHQPDTTIRQLSSIISLTAKAAKIMVKKKVSGAMVLLKRMIKWAKGPDRRFPKPADLVPSSESDQKELTREEAKDFLQKLAASLQHKKSTKFS